MIVGTRMRGWKRQRWIWQDGARRRACWFEVEHHDLHATKGWRLVKRVKRPVAERSTEWTRAPQYQEHFVPAHNVGGLRLTIGPSDPGRMMRRTPDPTPVRLTVHDWYRRQQFGSSARLKRSA